MPPFDRRTAMNRLNRYRDDKRASDEALANTPLTRETVVPIDHFGTTDYATGLAESLDGALALIDRLHPLIHVGDRLDRLPGWQYRAERESERLYETSGADPEDGYNIGYARAVSDFARFLLDGLAEDGLAKLLDL